MRKELIAYAAGLFDGEGYVRIVVRTVRGERLAMQLFGGISMTDHTAIYLLRQHFGGSIFTSKVRPKPTHKPLHSWAITSQEISTFLRLIRPYLLIKDEEVDVALEYQKSVDEWNHKLGGHHWTHPKRDSVMAHRLHLAERLRQLKLRIRPIIT